MYVSCIHETLLVFLNSLCVRTHAGDSEGFLEDGLARKHSLYRHGYQSGGGGEGKFLIVCSPLFEYMLKGLVSPFTRCTILHEPQNCQANLCL